MKFWRLLIFAALLVTGHPVFAGLIVENPTVWRLQNYIGNSVVIYWTNAADCPSGGIWMPASATGEDRDRFWSTVLTAKHSGKNVGIYYTSTGSTCTVDSFFIDV